MSFRRARGARGAHRRGRSRSLRRHLATFAIIAASTPLVALVAVVFSTSEDTTVFGPDASRVEVVETSSVPWQVPMAAIALVVVVAVLMWWWAGRAVRPIETITSVADEIQAGSLDRRIGLSGAPTEVQSLADSFDRMLDRLGTAVTMQHRLIEDTSHELRTPLTALAVNTEVMLAHSEPTLEDYRVSTERTEALLVRVQSTIDELLLDARSRTHTAQQVDNDLIAIVNRVVDQHRTLTPEATITVDGPLECRLGLDGPSVERALSNLVENAVRYSPVGAPVTVALSVEDDVAQLSVTDRGPGIDAADVDRIFDRYYRGDDGAGDAPADGAGVGRADGRRGIGLSLVRQVADAHGGITVESPVDPAARPGADGLGPGSRFTIAFRGAQISLGS